MNNQILIHNLQSSVDGDWVELSAELSADKINWQQKKLWYRYPKSYSEYVTKRYDPFLAALLPLAMKRNLNLKFGGPISRRLLDNSKQVIKIFPQWFDSMHSISIESGVSDQLTSHATAVGCFFTAGVDSFYTVLKNLSFYKNESRITHLQYVYGFDIDINNPSLFEMVERQIKSAAAELDLESIFIQTNLRQVTDPYVQWGEEQHGAALGSVALGLSNFLKITYIPSSNSFAELYKWGSHPQIDPLWTDGSFRIIHDGNEANRSQKIQWQLSNSDMALKHLRVCWRNPDNQYNCGECGKCIRTKINLELAGVLEKCKTLDNDLHLDLFKSILLESAVERRNLKENIEFAGNNNPVLKKKLQDLHCEIKKRRNSFNFKFRNAFKRI